MAKKITQQDIELINELYLQFHTYAAVSRETGFSAGTVKKYIISNYTPKEKINITHYIPWKQNNKNPKYNLEYIENEQKEIEILKQEITF